jgi:hypothetical protein
LILSWLDVRRSGPARDFKSRENRDVRNGGSKVEMKGAAEAELHQLFPILVIIEVNECYWLRYDPLYLLQSLRPAAMLRPFDGKRVRNTFLHGRRKNGTLPFLRPFYRLNLN